MTEPADTAGLTDRLRKFPVGSSDLYILLDRLASTPCVSRADPPTMLGASC